MSDLVTVRTFSNSVDFEIVKSYLESCGIECFVQDEIINRAYLANINGGAKLQVKPEEAEETIKLLLEKGYLKEEDFEPSTEMKWAEKIINFFRKK